MRGDRVAEVVADEREQSFRAGLAELRSFLSMADDRLQRLALFTEDDPGRARQVDELRACLEQARACINHAGPDR